MDLNSTLIISTYNWPDALELVLKSVAGQSILPTEIIIADDGSTSETELLINTFKDNLTIPLVHIWHEDLGFRKSTILNKALVKAKGDYIIQVDGDCILHTDFIKDHLALAQKEVYLYGSRVNIQKAYLNSLFNGQIIKFNFFSEGIKKRTRALRIPFFSRFYRSSLEFSRKYRGCNTSYFKQDAIKINGYNEDIQGWGREDSEFAVRLHNLGLKGKRIRYRGIIYHIFHKEKPKNRLTINNKIEKLAVLKNVIKCKNGMDKYLE